MRPFERCECIYRRIILAWLSKKLDERVKSGFTCSRWGPVVHSCEHGNGDDVLVV